MYKNGWVGKREDIMMMNSSLDYIEWDEAVRLGGWEAAYGGLICYVRASVLILCITRYS